jgi:hypothetical protein
MSSERDTCLRRADDAKQRAAQAMEPSIKSAYEKVAEYRIARVESLLAAEKITKTPSKKLTALPPSDVAADTQRVKESPERAGALGSTEERLAS